jgi:hypothetical protein
VRRTTLIRPCEFRPCERSDQQSESYSAAAYPLRAGTCAQLQFISHRIVGAIEIAAIPNSRMTYHQRAVTASRPLVIFCIGCSVSCRRSMSSFQKRGFPSRYWLRTPTSRQSSRSDWRSSQDRSRAAACRFPADSPFRSAHNTAHRMNSGLAFCRSPG